MIVMPCMFLKGVHWSYKNYYLPFMGIQQRQTADIDNGKLTPLARAGWAGSCPYHAVLRFFGFPVKSD